MKAFKAGNDILLIGNRDLQNQIDSEIHINEIIRIYHSMINAVKEGKISEERVNASVSRILKLKKDYGLFTYLPTKDQDLKKILRSEDHLKLANKIAHRSVNIKKWNFNSDFSKLNITIIAPKILEEKIKNTDLLNLGKQTSLYVFEGLEPSSSEQQQLLKVIKNTDYIIFCSYNSWKMPKQLELLNKVASLKPTACIATRDPYDLDVHHYSNIKIATYSPTSCSLQVVADYPVKEPNLSLFLLNFLF